MKHNPRVPEDEAAGGFYYKDKFYKVLIRNDDDDEIPHYYLKDIDNNLYCGFILNENLTDPYHKDHHNFIFEDENLISEMKDCLLSIDNLWKNSLYNILWIYWNSTYIKGGTNYEG